MTNTTQATKLQINWTNNECDCGNCDFTVETLKGDDSKLFDGDKVICNKCNKIGEIETLGNDGCDVIWSDKYQPKANKCIAVKTPFGNMYLELMDGTNAYKVSNDNSTESSLNCLIKAMLTIPKFQYYDDSWVIVTNWKGEAPSFLPITSNYGNTFP